MKIKQIVLLAVIATVLLNISCATKGLIAERYKPSIYKVPHLLPDMKFDNDQSFIVYSDNQSGFRGYHMVLDKDRWTSPWMLALPFYQLYLIGNGVVGVFNYIRHKPDYGHGNRIMVRDAIYQAAKQTEAAFILNIGDITAHDGRRPEHWKMFLDDYNRNHPILKEIPYLPALGNHDQGNDTTYGWPNYEAIFDFPRFYTIEFPDAVIIVLDSNFIIDQGDHFDNDFQDDLFGEWFVSNDPDNPSWLEKQLIGYDDKAFKIIAMHHPPFSFIKHYKDWLNPANGNDLITKRKQLIELLTQHDVNLVLSGHDHMYQHSELVSSSGDTHFIVGGGGGGTLRNPASEEQITRLTNDYREQGFDLHFLKQKKMFHYYEINFDENKLVVDVFEISDRTESSQKPVDRIILENNTRHLTGEGK